MVHTLLGPLHDLYTFVVEILVDQWQYFLLFLVDLFHFLRNNILLFGTVDVDVD